MAAKDKRITFRGTEQILSRVEKEGENGAEFLRKALTAYITAEEKGLPLYDPDSVDTGRTEAAVKRARVLERPKEVMRRFSLPVGDVVCNGVFKALDPEVRPQYVYEPHEGYESIAQTQLWWCPEGKLLDMQGLAEPFVESGGFSFHVGLEGDGLQEYPDVITTEEQERKPNGNWSVSSKLCTALIGDKLVWLEIEDPARALETLETNTAIPCAIRIDVVRYNDDDTYREACDKANRLFIYYFTNDRPVPTDDSEDEDDDY